MFCITQEWEFTLSRRRFTVTAVLVVAMLVPAVPATAATAPIVVCSGVTTTSYDPPLDNIVRTTNRTVSEELLCVPTSGMPFTGSRGTAVRGAMSCPILADPTGPLTFRYGWDSGTPASSVVKSVGYPGERMSSRAGSVIGGRFKGYHFIQVTDDVGQVACDDAGVAQTTRRTSVTFTAP